MIENRPASQQVKCSSSQGVLVSAPVDGLAHQLLGRGVANRSQRHIGGRKAADAFEFASNPEVGQQDSSPVQVGGSNQDVGRFDVTVQQTALMGEVQGVGDRVDDVDDLGHSNPAGAAAQQSGCVGAVDKVHRDPQVTVELTTIMHAHNVGMPQTRGDVSLAAKPIGKVAVTSKRCRQNFDRVHPRQTRMLGEIDLAHPPSAQKPDDAVPGEHLPAVQHRQIVTARQPPHSRTTSLSSRLSRNDEGTIT